MRGLRSTIALIVVLGGLGAYVYFVTWKKPDKEPEAKREKVFTSIQADKIEEIRVKSLAGDTTTLKKEDGNWRIVAPVAAKADQAEVSSITNNLGTVEVSRVIDENPGDLKDYGLVTPRMEIDFKGSGDKDFQKLMIGEKSPTGSDLFAKRNDDKRVFLIPAFQESAFNRTTFDFRDKTILKFDREKVDGIEITGEGKALQIAKQGTDWKILKPTLAKADTGLMEGVVGRLQSALMKSLVTTDASAADLKKYGFDKPTVAVTLSAGSSRATLQVGSKTKDNMYYARDASKSTVVTVDATFAENLKKDDVEQYRRKDLFEFRPYLANRLEITRGDQTVVFEMTKPQGNAAGKWRRVSPNPADVDREKFDSFLTKLSGMRGIAFPDPKTKTGDKPAMTVQVKFDETREEKVIFSTVESDVFAMRSGEATPVQASMADFKSVSSALDEVAK